MAIDAVTRVGSIISIVSVIGPQLRASVTLQLYEPAVTFGIIPSESGTPLKVYSYGGVPPPAVNVTSAEPPLQLIVVPASEAVNSGATLISIVLLYSVPHDGVPASVASSL